MDLFDVRKSKGCTWNYYPGRGLAGRSTHLTYHLVSK